MLLFNVEQVAHVALPNLRPCPFWQDELVPHGTPSGPADATGLLFVVGGVLLLASGGLLLQQALGVIALSGPSRRLGQRRP